MQNTINIERLSKQVGWSLLATVFIGMAAAMLISSGIDVNMSADIKTTAENMLNAESRLHAKAYVGLLQFMLGAFVSVGLFLILRATNLLVSAWSLITDLSATILTLLGSVYAMNAALIAGNSAFDIIGGGSQNLMLTSLQVVSDYTSFHLALILGCAAKVGIFYVFLKSGLIPRFISGWGIFASAFVVVAVVGRDFIPMLGSNVITGAFLACNLLALLMLGFYLGIKGVRIVVNVS